MGNIFMDGGVVNDATILKDDLFLMFEKWDVVQVRNNLTRIRIFVAKFFSDFTLSDMLIHDRDRTCRINIALQDTAGVYN